jgi:carbon-monoxide dehydrogenase iron sulfur subunit
MMKGMIVVRVDRCLGCKSCELACAVEHSKTKELMQALNEDVAPQSRVTVEQGCRFAVPLQCRQCEEAPCIAICPTNALYRADKDSPVVIDHGLCIGCKWCILACPFGVITLDSEGKTITKCDQCFERVERGELPACVSACPTRALQYKSLDEVISEKREATLLQIERSLSGDDK